MNKYFTCSALILIFLLPVLLGCGQKQPTPITLDPASASADSSRQLWGFWNVEVIPDGNGSAELVFTPVRSTQFHMNVVGIMESGGPAIGIDPPVTFVDGILDATISLTHPFPIDKFTGFDVRGILIGHGSVGGFSESLFYGGLNDIELVNADGHSRLWNPTEYTGSGYIDGKMSTPDAIANYTATLNGYKYFADGLTSDMAVGNMLKASRGSFSAGASNARHYSIRLGDKGLLFQYAVDANWFKPTEPVEVPGSFDVERANCPEPYHINVWIGTGITYEGGSADLIIDVYDWQKDVDEVYLEAPMLMDDILTLTDPVDNGDYVTFTGSISNDNLPTGDHADILIYARGVDPVSATTYTDYRLFRFPVPHMPAGGVIITIQDDMAYKTVGVEYEYGGSDYNYSTGNPAPVDYADSDGPWNFTTIPAVDTGTRIALSPTDPEVADFAGSFSGNVTHFFKTQLALGDEPSEIHQAEAHNESANLLRLWGIHSSEELMEGTDLYDIPLDPPIDFQYPMDINTDYTISKKYTIIPFLLTMTITFQLSGIGEGIVFIPVEPGVYGWGWETQPALETRTTAEIETGGVLGEGLMGTGLMYEWTADDGTLYGTLTAGNDPGSDPNFDEGTYEIIKNANASALRSVL